MDMGQAHYGKAKGMSMPNTATGRFQSLRKGKSYGSKAKGGYKTGHRKAKSRSPMNSAY